MESLAVFTVGRSLPDLLLGARRPRRPLQLSAHSPVAMVPPAEASTRRSSRLLAKRSAAGMDGPAAGDDEATAAPALRAAKARKTAGSGKPPRGKAAASAGLDAAAEDLVVPLAESQTATDAAAEPAARRRAGGASAKGAAKPKAAAASGPTRDRERHLWARGFKAVAGVDEAGRGPLAGPVVAAACILPPDIVLEGLDDSKKLSEEQREALYEQITTTPGVAWAVSVVGREVIDSINILQATMLAMEQAVAGLSQTPDYVLIDGNRVPKGLQPEGGKAAPKGKVAKAKANEGDKENHQQQQGPPQESVGEASGGEDGSQQQQQQPAAAAVRPCPAEAVVKGDGSVVCIAAASVIAKVTRDREMQRLEEAYPGYGLGQHKGYGVPAHLEAIRTLGYCQEHRRSFQPIKGMVAAGIGPVPSRAAIKGGSDAGASGAAEAEVANGPLPPQEDGAAEAVAEALEAVAIEEVPDAAPKRQRGRPKGSGAAAEKAAAAAAAAGEEDAPKKGPGRGRRKSTAA